MFQKCLLLEQIRVDNDNGILAKKWNISMRTESAAIKQAASTSSGHSNFLDNVAYNCYYLLILKLLEWEMVSLSWTIPG